MISNTTFDAIGGLAVTLRERDVAVTAVEDSALDIIYKSGTCVFTNAEQLNPENFIEFYKKSLEIPLYANVAPAIVATGSKLIPVREHEETLMFCKDEAIKLVNSLLDRSQNIVQPFFQSLVTTAQEIPTRTTDYKGLYEVKNIQHFSGWSNDWVSRVVSQFASVGEYSDNSDINLPNPPATLPSTGNGAYDDLLASYITHTGMSPAECLSDAFTQISNLGHPDAYESGSSFNTVMFVFLLLCAFEDEPWAESGVDLSGYKNAIGSTNNTLARWMTTYLDKISKESQEDILISGMAREGNVNVIYTNPMMFSKYIANGGSVEAIYGMYMMTKDGSVDHLYQHTSKIIEWNDTFVQAWDNAVTIDRTRDSHTWLELVRENVWRGFSQLLDADLDLLAGRSFDEVVDEFKEYIMTMVQLYNVNEIDSLILEALKASLFKGEQTVDVLRLIDMYLKEGMSLGHAQEQATIDVIFEWGASQLIASK